MASRGHKGSLPLVPLTYPDEVVGAAEVQLGKDGGSAEMFQSRWDEGTWITKFDGNLVEAELAAETPRDEITG